MFDRNITASDVEQVAKHGLEIESYPNDFPYPSRLLLGIVGGRAMHVVAAYNKDRDLTIVITVYWPNPAEWSSDFKTRRRT